MQTQIFSTEPRESSMILSANLPTSSANVCCSILLARVLLAGFPTRTSCWPVFRHETKKKKTAVLSSSLSLALALLIHNKQKKIFISLVPGVLDHFWPLPSSFPLRVLPKRHMLGVYFKVLSVVLLVIVIEWHFLPLVFTLFYSPGNKHEGKVKINWDSDRNDSSYPSGPHLVFPSGYYNSFIHTWKRHTKPIENKNSIQRSETIINLLFLQ